MRAARYWKLAPLALLVLGCSDPTGPENSIDDPSEVQPIPPFSLSVAPSSAAIRVGETITLSATVSGGMALLARHPAVTWFSANGDVATVSATGQVQGLRAGTALVWATYQGTRGAAHVRVFGPGKKAGEAPHGCPQRLPVPRTAANHSSC